MGLLFTKSDDEASWFSGLIALFYGEKPSIDMSAEELYQQLQERHDCTSLLKKHLTPEMFEKLKDRKTKHGGTLADVIRAGCVTLSRGTGIRVCDPDAYNVFFELLDPIILDYHHLPNTEHPEQDLGDVTTLPFSNFDDSYVISTRVRTGRCISGFSLYPTMTSEDRATVEEKIVAALSILEGDLKGTYYPLSSLSEEEKSELIRTHYLFAQNERMQKSGGYKDWPNNRGVFYNDKKTFIAWVNEEDHLRIISMDKGGDLRTVYTRFVEAVQILDSLLPFARQEGLGFVNTCPSNLGTGLRASVLVHIPRLSQREDFRDALSKYHLEARGVDGYGTDSVGGVYDISNKRRLGLTEIQAVNEMATGIHEIIKLEQELEQQITRK